jgi:hypothetical protein
VTTTITILLTIGLFCAGIPALIRWYTFRLNRARARYRIREHLRRHLELNGLPQVQVSKLTEQEKRNLQGFLAERRADRLIELRNQRLRDEALRHYPKESA